MMRRESSTVVALVGPGYAMADGAEPADHGPTARGPGDLRPANRGPGNRRPANSGPADHGSGTFAAPGQLPEQLLAELETSANVGVVRPPADEPDAVESATIALRQAARRSSSSFALVPADPLAGVAAQWQAMWDLARGSLTGGVLFEEQTAHVLAAWRARRFELPDYYVVLADAQGSGAVPDFYLGPLRAVRPHRVVVVGAAADGPEQAARIRNALRSLSYGPWWPPLDEVLDSARRFYAGGLTEAATSLATGPPR